MDKAELTNALNLGKAAQIGCVVRDVSKTIKHYEETIGIGPAAVFSRFITCLASSGSSWLCVQNRITLGALYSSTK